MQNKSMYRVFYDIRFTPDGDRLHLIKYYKITQRKWWQFWKPRYDVVEVY